MFDLPRNIARKGGTLVLFALAACATTPVDKALLGQVHTIALNGFAEPDYFLAARAHVGADSYRAIAKMLGDHGYRIVPDSKSADAVLTVDFPMATDNGAGEIVGHSGCEPQMLIQVTMKNGTGKTILRRDYFYGPPGSSTGVIGQPLLSDPKYNVPDCTNSGIMANADLIVEAFHSAVPELTQAVTSELVDP